MKIKSLLKKLAAFSKSISPVKYFSVFVLMFSLLFRFGGYATGNSPVYIRMGDVNGDGIVSAKDVLSFVFSRPADSSSKSFISADMNADGALTASDALSLIRLIGGDADELTEAESVSLSASSLTLIAGKTASLTAEVLPNGATVKQIVWSSSNEGVARVENGAVTAVSPGEALITACSGDGSARAQCAVTVTAALEGIGFAPAEIYIYEESAPVMLTPYTVPEGLAVSYVWDSSDWNVVSVDSFGGITPQGVGTAVVGASSPEYGATAAITVHVLPQPEPEAENAPDITSQRQQKTGVFTNYLPLSRTLNSMLDVQCSLYNVTFTSSASPASAAEVAKYVNPANFCEGTSKYQFLDLSVPNNISADRLNEYLKGRGSLSGMGQAFVDAANEFGVSEVYLVAHACLETGNGSSRLAKGIEYDGAVVYNMFGIGAYDGNALMGGAAYAASKGWTTPEAAIRGGAGWIAQNYIHRSKARQNTLYKMRWNPLSPGYHQYATDIGWAVKQAGTMAKIIGSSDCLQIFEIPVYSGTYTGYVPNVEPKTSPDYYMSSAEETGEATEEQPETAEPAAEEAVSLQPAPEQAPAEPAEEQAEQNEQNEPSEQGEQAVQPAPEAAQPEPEPEGEAEAAPPAEQGPNAETEAEQPPEAGAEASQPQAENAEAQPGETLPAEDQSSAAEPIPEQK